MPEYLSTSEVAKYLKLNQKKIYALIASGQMPAARVSGKWLFPKELVDRWVAERTIHPPGGIMSTLLDRVLVVQGSDDWLLSHVIQAFQARTGAAVPVGAIGSLGGLSALETGVAHVAGCHVASGTVREHARTPLYVLGLFEREQGLMFDRSRPIPHDLAAACATASRFAARQDRSGTARLVESLLGQQGLEPAWTPVGPYWSHADVALAIRAGEADVGVGTAIAARMAGLEFVPLATEEFDLVLPAEFLSHRRMNEFLDFVLDELGRRAAGGCAGYTFGPLRRLRTIRRDDTPATDPAC